MKALNRSPPEAAYTPQRLAQWAASSSEMPARRKLETWVFFPTPTSTSLDPQSVTELDDALFSSDPYAYFCARIESIASDPAPDAYETEVGRAVCAALGRPAEHMPRPPRQSADLQRAMDAISLRHHVAETLVRTWLAVLETHSLQPGITSVWATLSEQPTQIAEVLKRIGENPGNGNPQVHLKLVAPPEHHDLARSEEASYARALEVLGTWLGHAEFLLTRNDIHLAASANKVKHGLAVRARDDLRLDFIAAERVHGDVSALPKSVLEDSVPIIDRPSVLYLARPPRRGNGKEALELTCLRLDTPTILAEAFMLATTHGAIFHTAALRHEQYRGVEIGIPPYPTLPTGPTNDKLVGNAVTGLRAPVTRRPDGQPSDRRPGLGFNDGTFLPLASIGPRRRGIITND